MHAQTHDIVTFTLQSPDYDIRGENCCDEFIEKLDELTEVEGYEKEWSVIVLFHNLKGFDGVFLLESLYRDMRDVLSTNRWGEGTFFSKQ